MKKLPPDPAEMIQCRKGNFGTKTLLEVNEHVKLNDECVHTSSFKEESANTMHTKQY